MRPRLVYFLVSALVFALILALLARRGPILAQDQRLAKPPAHAAAKRQLQGNPSCSASICHGGNDIQQRFSETITWQALDPHARAYDTLLSAQSQGIAKRLWNDQTPAHAAPLCLKCHVHPDYDHARPNFRQQDGVGCESCHGAAQDWLKPHYSAAWLDADRERLGFADTKHLRGRAEICVRCHVGTPEANVDHDLIAAGHPALRFEFATYFANLPAHWDRAKDRKANAPKSGFDFDWQAWLVGQDVSAATAADLLAYRVHPANGKPWPELAELDCFVCHHDLQGRQRKFGAFRGRPGRLEWNGWYAEMTAVIRPIFVARPVADPEIRFWLPDPTSDRALIAKRARNKAEYHRGQADTDEAGAHEIRMLREVAWEIEKGAWREIGFEYHGWDFRTQFYFALLAARTSYTNENLIAKLRQELAFPPGYDSPKRIVPPLKRLIEKNK